MSRAWRVLTDWISKKQQQIYFPMFYKLEEFAESLLPTLGENYKITNGMLLQIMGTRRLDMYSIVTYF